MRTLALSLLLVPVLASAQQRRSAPALTTPDSATVARIVDGMRWRFVGPARGGRVTTVTGVVQEPHTFYMGSTGGGVWKTVDAGITWDNVTDGFLDVGSIGSIDVSDSDPNIVWVGTGSEGLRSNVSIGRGIWKSGDAGKTWRMMGLRDAGQLGSVVVHPGDPNVVYVAAVGDPFRPNAGRGLYRTVDGGTSWKKVLFISDSTGFVDVELEPGNPRVVYAAAWRAERKPWTIISGARECALRGACEGGLWKSEDSGDTWRRLGGGLPDSLVGKIDLAVSAAAPRRVYALVEAKPGGGLYRSDDAGATWTRTSAMPQLITRPFYYDNVDADPTNADVVYVGSEGFYKSTDGGRTFRSASTPHGDNHDLWIHPRDARIMIQSNDGGANVSLDGGRTWSTQYNQPTAEIYQVAVDDQVPYRLYGAQQDNSTVIVPSRPLSSGSPDDPMQEWRQGPGCETGPIIPHPTNPDTVYGSCKGQFSRTSLRTGQERQYWVGAQSLYGNAPSEMTYRFQRVSPMEVSPWDRRAGDPRVVYYGSQYVHRTRDEGVTWERISPDLTANDPRYRDVISGEPITIDNTGEEYYATLYAIRESPVAKGVIWTGANDGPVYVSRDDGRTWTNVTPPDLPPGGRVQNIEPSPHRAGGAYIAVLRYQLGDWQPYAYRTNDYGKTWTRLTTGANGVPRDHPVRVVREDPERAGLLYLGTEFGAWVSFDDGGRWVPMQGELPATPVTDLRVAHGDLVASTQGRAFWILDDLGALRQASAALASAPAHLFATHTTPRLRYSGQFGGVEGEREASADQPEYPPMGANIDYWLAAPFSSPVTVEIRDARGALVRRWRSDNTGANAAAARGDTTRRPNPTGAAPDSMAMSGTAQLRALAGLNRLTWDLRWPGPWSADGRSGRNGPLAAPGRYTVRLSAGDSSWTQPLVLTLDPRAKRDGMTDSLSRAQQQHELAARDLVTRANLLVARVQRARTRLTAAGASGADSLARLTAATKGLEAETVRYGRPGLVTNIAYLYGMTTDADQRVGKDARDRLVELRKALDAMTTRVNAVLGAEPTR